ncbi:MAG: NAD(P)H-dependent oxidoreductase subunit E [Filifactoraceae bacterium]
MKLQDIRERVDAILLEFGEDKSQLINVMQAIQKEYRYLPQESLEYISKKMDVSESKIYGVATFYENFSLEPKGEFVIKICDGTACHVRKSIPILNALKKELKLENGKNTTQDMKFTVETVSCLGACGLAPVITINDKVFPKMTPENVVMLVGKIREEGLC